jgi:hypothetical protein
VIQVHDNAIPAALCERIVTASRDEHERLHGSGWLSSTLYPALDLEEASSLAGLSEVLHGEYALPLLWEFLLGEARLSHSRSAFLPELSRLSLEAAREGDAPGQSEPVPWPERDGVCLVACLNEGAPNSERTFSRQGRRIGHQRGRVIVFPTSWVYDYVLRPGDAELCSLVVFAAVSTSTRLYDLDSKLTDDELRCARLYASSGNEPHRKPWLPSPPIG